MYRCMWKQNSTRAENIFNPLLTTFFNTSQWVNEWLFLAEVDIQVHGKRTGTLSSLVPGMSGYQIQIIIGVQEGHVVLLNTAVHHIHQTGGGNSLNFHPKTLQKKPTHTEYTCGWPNMIIFEFSDLDENRSGHWGSFRHDYFTLFSIKVYSVCKRFPIVPSWHSYEMTTPRPPGKLIGHPSDLKRSCQLNATLL